ncbi:MAG: type 4a pilus biogenesis protein PilO [Candidatus Omnitrophica bacterium]|nr:type 4a pilus biogenesis protein PilO [Candidatus Omnitrophota bacterium]
MISQPQKKILSYTAAGAAIIVVFVLLAHLPANARVRKLQAQADAANRQLNETKKIGAVKDAISKGYFYTQSIDSLKKDLESMRKKLPAEKEAPLQYIGTSATKFGLELLFIKPLTEKPVIDENERPLKIKDSECLQLPVNLKIKGGYKSIGIYIESLEENSPFLITVSSLDINKVLDKGVLTADMTLNVYLRNAQKY